MARGRGIGDTVSDLLRSRGKNHGLIARAQRLKIEWQNLTEQDLVSQPPVKGPEEDLTQQALEILQEIENLGELIYELATARMIDEDANTFIVRLQHIEQRLIELDDLEMQTKTSINMAKILYGADSDAIAGQMRDLQEITSEVDTLLLTKTRLNQALMEPYLQAYLEVLKSSRSFGGKLPASGDKDLLKIINKAGNIFPRDWMTKIPALKISSDKLDPGILGEYADDEIVISEQADPRATVHHELAHHISAHDPILRLLGWGYVRKREAKYVDGGFLDDYVCRKYSHKGYGKIPETEVISMAAGAMSGADYELWKVWHDDAEYRNFYLGVLLVI